MANASVALAEAQALLNDVGASLFTDAVLLPSLKKAHRELQVLLWENGLPVIKEVTAVIDVAANATSLGANLPTDILEPKALQERVDGSTSEDDWRDVPEADPLPRVEPSARIMYWAWREEVVEFIAPTTAREVKLRYLKGLTVPTSGSSAIGLIFGELYLGPRLASIAVQTLGNTTRAEELTNDAAFWIPKILAANVKRGQAIPTRRIPYRRNLRRFII